MYNYQYYPYYQQQQQYPTLYGKIVEGLEVVRGIDVPIGTSAVFPTASGSSVFIKSWNADGTTKIEEYQKISNEQIHTIEDIYNSIITIGKRLDNLKSQPQPMSRRKAGSDDE